MTGLGLNIDLLHLSDAEYATLKNYLLQARPPLIVAMDNYPRAVELARLMPDTAIVYRQYLPDDIWQQSADAWVNVHAALPTPPSNVWFYALNEPPLNADVVRWLDSVARQSLARGWRVVLGNFSVGVPEPSDWLRARSLVDLIARNRERLMLGLHEYFPTYAPYEFQQTPQHPQAWPPVPASARPFLLGRFRYLLDFCARERIPTPRIAVTEFGTDTIPAVLAWQSQTAGYQDRAGYQIARRAWDTWRPSSMTVGQYAGALARWAWVNLYKAHPEIVGLAWFCAGGQGVWRDHYNVLSEADFLQDVTKGFERANMANYVINAMGETEATAKVSGVSTLNVRAQPTTAAAISGTLRDGQTIAYYTDSDAVSYAANGSVQYRWYRTTANTWFARVPALTLTPVNDGTEELKRLLQEAQNALDAAAAIVEAM